MTTLHPFRTATLHSIARRFTLASADERRADCNTLLDEGVRFLYACRDVGMAACWIDETARGLHDQLSKLMGQIDRDLDDVGCVPADPLQMGELEDLFQ